MTAFDRARPYPARLVAHRSLSGPGSDRPTLHVALSIAGSGFAVEPGDTVGVFVRNEPALVEALLARLDGADEAARAMLTERRSLGTPSLKLLRALAERVTDDEEAAAIEDLCDDDDALDAYLAERDLLDVLDEHPGVRFTGAELEPLLPLLQPRTFSVASSLRRHPDEVHLAVGVLRWTRAGRARTGVASAHLAAARVGDTLPIYWQPSAHFRAPAAEAPLLCIGPGTGVAPFRGFLQERRAPVWLFFGARTRAHDFYYRDELEALPAPHRLTLAFSRDPPEQVYVQHRLREHAAEVRAFVERGAHVYLCGDAGSMAPAVEAALGEILGDGALTRLRDEKRYHRDVY